MDNKTIRIRTTPGVDKNIKVDLNQDFDFIEILSLKISQEDIYESFCADYGVVVGRVIANEGFGVPNAKVSIFIPISDEDQKNELIATLYPYKTITSINNEGVRYNLLLSKSTCSLNVPVGTFPTKETVLGDDTYLEIFDKYYKYTTVTNDAGDYIIFGVPTGTQTVHMDVDLSDIGFLSLRPYDLKAQGFPENLFDGKKFKSSTNLDSLAQIKTQNKGVDVIPFWGDSEKCNFGITRVDFNIGNELTANAIFMGSIFTDTNENVLDEDCKVKKKIGQQSQLITGPGQVDILKLNIDINGDPISIDTLPAKEIDSDGVFVFTLPLYYDRVITDEFGEIIKSPDQTKGIPTKGKYRFKLKFDGSGNLYEGKKSYQTASLVIPSTYKNVRFTDNINEYSIYASGPALNTYILREFHTFEWKQVYTTTQFIRKLKPTGSGRFDFIGLKREYIINEEEGESTSFNAEDDDQTTTKLDIPYNVLIRRNFAGFSRNKKFKLCFYDSWLNGGCYMFKFRIKRKSNGELKCCGLHPGACSYPNSADCEFCKEGGGTYQLNGAIEQCAYVTPEYSTVQQTGAGDTGENIYCKWALDTRIMNIGSMEMCQETLDVLNENLSNIPTDPIKNFTKGGGNDCIGTNIESGIRTQNIIDYLPEEGTTYVNIADFFPSQVTGLRDIPNPSGFIDGVTDPYAEKELKQSDGGSNIRYYCRLDYPNNNINDQSSFTTSPFNTGVLSPLLYSYVGCPANAGDDLYYASRYDHPYFYFGSVAGSTALHKLRKDFF